METETISHAHMIRNKLVALEKMKGLADYINRSLVHVPIISETCLRSMEKMNSNMYEVKNTGELIHERASAVRTAIKTTDGVVASLVEQMTSVSSIVDELKIHLSALVEAVESLSLAEREEEIAQTVAPVEGLPAHMQNVLHHTYVINLTRLMKLKPTETNPLLLERIDEGIAIINARIAELERNNPMLNSSKMRVGFSDGVANVNILH